ncbi:Nnf1-domain-containing protein [Dothidotthia symphoricarpi CBS 119687]|uniref:Nnf1-domain-containing protein n=1 Tax=Dothidotthia symphoricarpi CBS 119687 TaxID=1392245 RepID=A0A6A6AK60_9PLEO|nr:Nnf1-domain-containing protein [Dothidotthia symphoricarpi CBS 119687]KAF2132342.1 Nnf1-domain-containing protein [Dothidotthia symphoricarpi CBS 119687]
MSAPPNPASRSPSPTPAPPIADAPGPRAQGLINVFNQASKATLDKCSSKNFASCFPTAAQYSPEVLDNLRGQIVDQLDRTWKGNFDDIMARRDVVKLLNSLDQSIEDAKLRKKRAEVSANGGPVEAPVPPHTLAPADIHLAHLMPFLEKQAADMNTKLADTQRANTELLSAVTAQRAEIEALVRGLENVIQDLDVSAQMMGRDEVQDLSREIRDVEIRMRT